MTLQELRDQAFLESGIAVQASTPEQMASIDRLLNNIQLRYGAKWLVPRLADAVTGHTAGTYTITGDVYTGGIISVRDDTNGQLLEIMNTAEADREHPDRVSWDAGQPRFVEISPTNPNQLIFHPAPASPFDFTVRYALRPALMELSSDEPWNGQFPEFHYIIAKRAALQLAATRIGNFDSNDAPTAMYTILRAEVRDAEAQIEGELQDFGVVYFPDWWGLTKI